jgi:hypothetical protein
LDIYEKNRKLRWHFIHRRLFYNVIHMHKKDYELIAKVIKENRYDIKLVFINALAQELKVDNPNFDKMKFFEACGVQTW